MVPSNPCQIYSKLTKIDDVVISYKYYAIIKAFGLAQLFLLYLVLAQSYLFALTKRFM